jgi:hypothetical protein
MAYACLAWEFAADNHVIKLQRLQNKVLRTTGKQPRSTPVRDLYMCLKLDFQRTRRCYISEDRTLHNPRCENIGSDTDMSFHISVLHQRTSGRYISLSKIGFNLMDFKETLHRLLL